MLTAEDVRVLDLNSAFHGVPTSVLMRNAGRAVAEEVMRRHAPTRVLVLAGLGNNGGDGAVAADVLAQGGVAVTVLLAADSRRIRTPEARLAFATLDGRGVRVEAYRSPQRLKELLSDADLVIDALLGVGARGDLREPIRTIARAANASRRTIVAIDVPTGLGGKGVVNAGLTVTLHDRKPAMSRHACGTVVVRDIGIPARAAEIGPGDLVVHYPRPEADSHKGENGRLLAILGGPYTGAPILASMAAARTGCDLVHLATPQAAARAAQAHAPDLIVHAGADPLHLVPEDVDAMEPLLARVDAVLMGSGLGSDRRTRAAVERVLEVTQRRRLPLVLDADALAVAGKHPDLLRRRPVLATPHAAEFRALTGRTAPRGAGAAPIVQAQARRLGCGILLKARVAVATDGRATRIGRIHPPGLTPGGIGDVLAGSCAALVARGLDPLRAATAGSFLVGAAARTAFDERSWGARASDVLEALPRTLRTWLPSLPLGGSDTVLT